MTNNLQNYYNSTLVYDLITKLPRSNFFNLPKITKIHLNMGLKTALIEKKKIISMLTLLKLILNQDPIITKSKKNIIIFKIKKNSIIGCKLTLQKKQNIKLLEKLVFLNLSQNVQLTLKHSNIINFQINNKILLNMFELKTEFFNFQNLPVIDISLQTNTLNLNEFKLLLNLFFLTNKK